MDSLGEIRQKMAESFHRIQDMHAEITAMDVARQGAIEEAIAVAMEVMEETDPATAIEVKSEYPLQEGGIVVGAMAFNTVEQYEEFMHELMESEIATVLEEAGIHYWWNEKLGGWIRMVLLP